MSELKRHENIPKDVNTQDDLDYSFLKKKGIEYIERLGSKLWTDFNSHDPGITILEVLAYAITDLGMRLDLPIQDLLSSNDKESFEDQFFKASEVLPISPVTEKDYRKLFLDIEGVKNCWLTVHQKYLYADLKKGKLSYNSSEVAYLKQDFKKQMELKGLFDIYVDYDDAFLDKVDFIDEQIRERYHANRNLCEDLVSIKKIKDFPIKICTAIDVENTADEERVHALILESIDKYFSPTVNFYSIDQMLEKGYTSTTIFDGPILENGFIDDVELEKASLRSEVRLSDIINLIMSVPGVKSIKTIAMGECGVADSKLEDWVLCMAPYQKPILCNKSVFNYSKGVLPLSLNINRVNEYLEEFDESKNRKKYLASINKTFALPVGQKFDLSDYTSIQKEFPQTYGVGPEGLVGNPTKSRVAKSKQLKGYLLFFDQILASYFKHLEKVSDLLSVKGNLKQTFFTQALKDVKGIERLVTDYDLEDDRLLSQMMFENQDNDIERRNKLLDHLLARFAERFSEYTFIMRAIYGKGTDDMVLRSKEAFLDDYKITSRDRGNAANFYKRSLSELWDTNNVSGTEKRIARLLGIKNYNRRSISQQGNIEIYELINSNGIKVFRWRIKDNSGKILLSATDDYCDLSSANREMYFAISQILQLSEEKIENVFKRKLKTDHEFVIDAISIVQSDLGKYSFDIINPKIKDLENRERIIARRFSYYKTQEELKEAILDTVHFFKEEFSEEGMFLIEHILLRPDVTIGSNSSSVFLPIGKLECDQCTPTDQYSYRVSIVIPGYTSRFMNTDFRNYMEKIIKETLPSHVLPKICWVGYRHNKIIEENENDLLQFENAYKTYLLAKTNLEQKQPQQEVNEFINKLTQLSNIYPTGRLFDCGNEEETLSGNIILGKTNLGSL